MDVRGSYSLGLMRFLLLKRRVRTRRNARDDDKVFCQNSGGTGSHNIVKLFHANGVVQSYHEKRPDLEQLGLSFYLGEIGANWIERVLQHTRSDVKFEANNRLFSMSRELFAVFPKTKFIFLHRDGRDAVRSQMKKIDDPTVLKRIRIARRYNCGLNGPMDEEDPFRKACHYWTNMNKRIADDLEGLPHVHLSFDDMIVGKIDHVEQFRD
ncbi:MAG: sulfotransferase, partial [Pirellulales bacterium]|nr:sulfotransferase [Pirellulales bacterium]